MIKTRSNSTAAALEAAVRQSEQTLREIPFYGRLLQGQVTREEYSAWLAQLHKYVRYTETLISQLAAAFAGATDPQDVKMRDYALLEAKEEAFHDDLVIVDLSRLWDVSRAEARGRVELEATAPAILTYSRLRETLLSRYPTAILGVAYALETISALHSDQIRESLVQNSRIEGIQRATTFLKAHSGAIEGAHQAEAESRLETLQTAADRAAAVAFGKVALGMFEGIAFYLDQKFEQGA